MSKKYDAIVIGAGNGGLTSATRLALNGMKTLLLEKHNLPGGFATSFVRGRFEFEASLHELCGIGPLINDNGNLAQIFKELGVFDRVEWISLPDAFRTITVGDGDENFDYDMPIGKENFIAKAEEYVPGSRAVCEEIFDLIEQINDGVDFLSTITDFKPGMIKEIFDKYTNFVNLAGYSVNQVFDAMKVPKPIRDMFSGYWCYLGVNLDELNAIHYFTMFHSYIVQGATIPKKRSHGISCALLDRFEELGGEAWMNTKVEKILVKDKKAYGVRLESGEEILADYIVCNASPYNAFNKLIDRKEVPTHQLKNFNAKKLAAKGFAVFLGLNKSPEELGMKNHTYFIYDTADTKLQSDMCHSRETNGVQATVNLNAGDPDCSPKGTTILYMTSLFLGETSWDDVTPANYVKLKREFADRMIENFEEATGIKIRESIEEIEIAAPVTYAHYTDAPNGTIYGFDASGTNSIVHRLMTSAMGDKIKNLYFAGGYTEQCIGFSPSYTTGNAAAHQILTDAAKKEANA